jgi:glycosyltransferase involved in cell wall biosynthesis
MEQVITPKISIITITRNRANILSRAIRSVLEQTFTDFEYIIIDGASDDGTYEIITEFAKKDSRVRYVQQAENTNVIQSINQAFDLSRGNYITFLDDDDEYLPSKLEKQLKLIKSLPKEFGFVYCWMDKYDDKTGKLLVEVHDTIRGSAIREIIHQPRLGGTPTMFFRREAFKILGGWSLTIKMPSDWEMVARASQLFLTDYVPEVLVKVHLNHEYERQSDQIRKSSYQDSLNRIEFHEHFLLTFQEYFIESPRKKLPHLFPIIKNSMQVKYFSKALKSSLEVLRISFKNFPKVIRLLFSGLIHPVHQTK